MLKTNIKERLRTDEERNCVNGVALEEQHFVKRGCVLRGHMVVISQGGVEDCRGRRLHENYYASNLEEGLRNGMQ